MTRPLGYSVERPEHAEPDAPIALVHSVRCSLCWGSGKLDDGWTIRCPDGCEFTTSARPVARDVKCKTCSGRWDSDKYTVVKAHRRDCYDCRGTARRGSSSMLSEAEARTLRDALTAALGEDSIVERVGAVLVAEGCDCACGHDYQDHDDDCIRCLGCRVDAALSPEVPRG